jgi:hypothetical protein
MNPDYFLREGKFTKRNKIVKNALGDALNLEVGTTDFEKISSYLSHHFATLRPWNPALFRKRTASQIISSRKSNGCTDYGLVFLTLVRELGIPAKYVETIEKENLSHPERLHVSGHIFVELFINGKWEIYEPFRGFQKSYSLGEKKFIPIARGLDFSNLTSIRGKRLKLESLTKVREARDNISLS